MLCLFDDTNKSKAYLPLTFQSAQKKNNNLMLQLCLIFPTKEPLMIWLPLFRGYNIRKVKLFLKRQQTHI